MKSEAEDIEMLARAIMVEAEAEAAELQVEAKQKVEVIHRRAQDQAASEARIILDRARQDAERLRSQAVATTQLASRSGQLESREKFLDAVFEAARNQLEAVKKRPDYSEIAARLMREALLQLRATKAEIRADETAQKSLKKAVDEASKEMSGEFMLGGALSEGTGVVVDTTDGKLHYDNTLETRLSRMQSTLRSAVYKVLMGEQA